MTDEQWQQGNNQYLAASLQWLRLRLIASASAGGAADNTQAAHQHSAAPPVSPPKKRRGFWSRLFGEPPPELPAATLDVTDVVLRPQSEAVLATDESIRAALDARSKAAAISPLPALALLEQRLGLSPFERDTLLLCAAVEFDPKLAALYARVLGPGCAYPTFGLALTVLDDPSWEALAAHRPLRHDQLLEINQPGATPLTSAPLRAEERIVNFIKGLNVADDRLLRLCLPLPNPATPLAPSQEQVAQRVLQRLRSAGADAPLPVVQFVGTDTENAILVAQRVCTAMGQQLYRIGLESVPVLTAEVDLLARLWLRESCLLPLALLIDATDLSTASAEANAALQRLLSSELGVVFVAVRDAPVRLSTPSYVLETLQPTPEEQCELWCDQLKELGDAHEISARAAELTGQFSFGYGDIMAAVSEARSELSAPADLAACVWDTCRKRTRPRLDALAQRLEVKATWDDLVLPREQLELMRALTGQVRTRHRVYSQWGFSRKMNRGYGISALFAGESGTGKTMAAEVIANELQLDLYRIDLSAVISKYIGETEKNLRKLFDAAERGGAILFFDEADALFGKRSEVKDSHDRYANIEINYLLQRMESFGGLAILATNQKAALDSAFLRRLRCVIRFIYPGPDERKQIWQRVIPPETPRADLDFDRLAKLNVAGAHIQSIALHAAFLAANADQDITMPLLLSAARAEMRKLEKPFSESEFRI